MGSVKVDRKRRKRSNSRGGHDFAESSKQAETRLKYRSCSKSCTYQNIVYKNTTYKKDAYKSTSQKKFRKQRQLSSSNSDTSEEYGGVTRKKLCLSSCSSDDYGVIRKKPYLSSCSSDDYGVIRKKRFQNKVRNEDIFVGDSDYLMYLKILTGDKEKDKDDNENENEDYDAIVVHGDSDDDEDDEENDVILVDTDSDMVDMSGNGTAVGNELNPDDSNDEDVEENEGNQVDVGMTGVGNELNPDDSNDEDVEENENIQVDVGMTVDSGNEIDVGGELDPEYKMFCENLREDGEIYILEMEREKGGFEPSLPSSCSKGKSIPVNNFHPLLDECKQELTSTADEGYCEFLKKIGVIDGSLIMRTNDTIPSTGKHKVTLSVPEKSSKDGFPCSKNQQREEENRGTISDPGKSMKDGLCYCKDPEEKPHKPQKSCDSQLLPNSKTDGDDLGTDCSRSEYKKRLEECINMPYDEKEFADKWELASRRKECERVSETAGHSVSYATEKTTRSYLDFHPDLAELVDRALARLDGCKALLLLRCLFFYNEHVADEGAFIPWKDPSFERMLLDPV
ncbi:hypothetical protein MKW98_026166 [Papaver atlanticum]|uniref:Uncharacterized protein n=1 Tax=Papaver atlanticum TaxID=357466 RepID=A0AAD4XZL4_9MAGN|nr:hypothetical protein MKW98_026166 [Papaver atlanticum]